MVETAEVAADTPPYGDEFPHPYVTVDVVLLTVRDAQLGVLTIRREIEPVGWALPGAFVQTSEDVDETAHRVIDEKLGFATVPQFIALRPFGAVDRDPRRRVITLPYLALVDLERLDTTAGGAGRQSTLATVRLDGSSLTVSVDGRPGELVFDHEEILAEAVREVRRRVELDDPQVHGQLLPEEFTLRHLQEVHEAILGRPVNRDSFRRRVLTSGRLEDTGRRETAVGHRPASLYRWRELSVG